MKNHTEYYSPITSSRYMKKEQLLRTVLFFLLVTLLINVSKAFHLEKEPGLFQFWFTMSSWSLLCHCCAQTLPWQSHLQSGQSLILALTVPEAAVLLGMGKSIH